MGRKRTVSIRTVNTAARPGFWWLFSGLKEEKQKLQNWLSEFWDEQLYFSGRTALPTSNSHGLWKRTELGGRGVGQII